MKDLILNKDYVVLISYKHEINDRLPVKNLSSRDPFLKVKSLQIILNV